MPRGDAGTDGAGDWDVPYGGPIPHAVANGLADIGKIHRIGIVGSAVIHRLSLTAQEFNKQVF
jgi:hypothetical protein